MKLSFLGAARTVTGSFHVVDAGGVRFAIDCGLFQGSADIRERNYQPFRIDPATIQFMILTHAHIDHSGLIPKLCRAGFTGPVYCTHATADLAGILLPDSAHIQVMEVERKNRKAARAGGQLLEPIYTVEDAEEAVKQLVPVAYDEVKKPNENVEFRLRDAGHILGSAIVEVWVRENGRRLKIVFSGDLGNDHQNIIKDPTNIDTADYLVLESTYGDRLHQSNSNRIDQLLDAIQLTYKKGGNLVIPAFAVERTQDLLYDLNVLTKKGKLPQDIKIFIDSPLAIAATEIFANSKDFYDAETRQLMKEGVDPFHMPNMKFTRTQDESARLNQVSGHNIIISASGMCDAGRIKHHLKHNLWRPEATILFVGYQAQGTLGRRLIEGEKKVTIHGEEVAVKADIRQIDGYSAHADQAGILSWLKRFDAPPQQVILVHGEEGSLTALGELIQKEMNVSVAIPSWLDEIELLEPKELSARLTAAAAQESPAAAPPISHAIQAEQAYLEFCLAINKLYQQNWAAKNYDSIVRELEFAKQVLNERLQ